MTKKVEKKTAGLVFKQNSGDYITEVFGLDHEKYHKIVKDIAAFLITTAVAGLYGSKTEAFEGYLGSVQFKKQGFSLKTPNDYFMLGYMFNHAMEFQHEFEKQLVGMKKASEEGDVGSLLGKLFSEIAKELPAKGEPKKHPGVN